MFFMLPGILIPEDMVIQVLKAFEVTGESVTKQDYNPFITRLEEKKMLVTSN